MSNKNATEESQCLNLTSGHNTLSYRLNNYVKEKLWKDPCLSKSSISLPYYLIKLKLGNILKLFISTLFLNCNVLHSTQGPTLCANTIWLNIHLQLGHLRRGYHWVHLKREVMQFLVNKREQIYDDMVIHG